VTYALQWQRCSSTGTGCSPVAGASSSTYTVSSADVGHTLLVAVTATNRNGSATASSGATGVVAPPPAPAPSTTTTTTAGTATSASGPFANQALPTISGTNAVGSTLTAGAGTWNPTPLQGFYYAWHRCKDKTYNSCPNVGTNSKSYALTSADVGAYMVVQVAPNDSTGNPIWAQSADSTWTNAISGGTTTTTPTTTTTTTTTPTPTTTTTTSTPAPASGSIEFNGLATQMQSISSTGYSSSNNLSQSQSPVLFDGLAYTNDDILLASESTFGKVFNVSAEPGSRNPYNTGAPANDAMSELSKRQPTGLGTPDYYGLAVKIPSATWHNPDWASLMSLGYETLSYDQLGLHVYPSSSGPLFQLMQNGGYLNCPSTTCNGTVSGRWTITPVTYDRWFEFVFAVKWATDNTGYVKVYMRNPGGAWTLALDRENVATYAYGTSAYGTVSADMHEKTSTLDKFGLYYGYWNTGMTSFPKNTIQESGLVRATSLATAQSMLP
jgi:Polysaccharide lyase